MSGDPALETDSPLQEAPIPAAETGIPPPETDTTVPEPPVPTAESIIPPTTPDPALDAHPVWTVTKFIMRCLRKRRLAQDTKRRAIVRELIQTEKNYVDSLLICEEVYYKPLNRSITSKTPLIDAPTLNELFGNLEEIRAAHQTVVTEMDLVAPRLKRIFPPRSIYLRICGAFDEIIPRMHQLYTHYLSTNSHAEEILKRLSKNKKFKSFLSECLFNPRTKCQEIEDLLILPTQRVAGYKMLFERVLRYFPAETFRPILAAFQLTLEGLLRIGASMNQEKADTGSQEMLLTIAETMTRIPPVITILKPGRKFIGRFTARVLEPSGSHKQEVLIYVTSDLVFISRRADTGGGGKWAFRDAIPITQVRFGFVEAIKYLERGFILKSDTESYSLVVKNTDKRTTFINAVKSQKHAIKGQVARQTGDGAEYIQSLLAQINKLYEAPVTPLSREEALDSIL
jgi:hypothetical protein